jgi:hypothetical protein
MFIQLQYRGMLVRGIKKPANTSQTQRTDGAMLLAKPNDGVADAQKRENYVRCHVVVSALYALSISLTLTLTLTLTLCVCVCVFQSVME